MEKTSLPLQFEFDGKQYDGWATPSDQRHPDGYAKSYQVVLNQVFFGNLSFDGANWLVDEQRPHNLVTEVGKCLDGAIHLSVNHAI